MEFSSPKSPEANPGEKRWKANTSEDEMWADKQNKRNRNQKAGGKVWRADAPNPATKVTLSNNLATGAVEAWKVAAVGWTTIFSCIEKRARF